MHPETQPKPDTKASTASAFAWEGWSTDEPTKLQMATKSPETTSSLPTFCSSSNGSIAGSDPHCHYSESDLEQKSWSTVSRGNNDPEESTGKFSYKEILLLNECPTAKVDPTRLQPNDPALPVKQKHLDNTENEVPPAECQAKIFPDPPPPDQLQERKPSAKGTRALKPNGMGSQSSQVGTSPTKKPLQKKNQRKNRREPATSPQDNLRYTRIHTNGNKFTRLGGSRIDTTIIREAISQAVSQGVINKGMKRELRQSLLRGDTGSVLDALRRECHLHPLVTAVDNRYPTEYEMCNSNGLVKFVHQTASIQDSDELAKKHIVVMEVERIVDSWVAAEATRLNRTENSTSSVFVSGSSYLKIDTADSDLDLVALVPIWVSPEAFFSYLYPQLKDRTEVRQLIIMDEMPKVNGLSFLFNGIQVDLTLSIFTQRIVPRSLPIHSDHILCGMSPASVRSISGPRVAALILELVPNPASFRTCLQAVRLWARRRELYSSKVGFLGGVSWAVLVAFICQMSPQAAPSTLFHQFFTVLSTWKWPTPILLSRPYNADLGFPQWSPQDNIHDRAHAMPIITPGYPAVNSAATVNLSTLRVLQEEFMRGRIVLDGMMMNGLSSPVAWAKLFECSDFCVRYNHYFCINLSFPESAAQDIYYWQCVVQSRLRKLVETLQLTPQICAVHPLPSPQEVDPATLDDTRSKGCSFYVGFETSDEVATREVIDPIMNYFLATELQAPEPHHIQEPVIQLTYCLWHELPDSFFPQGKQYAAGERAKFVLRQTHDMHMMASSVY